MYWRNSGSSSEQPSPPASSGTIVACVHAAVVSRIAMSNAGVSGPVIRTSAAVASVNV